MGTDDSTKQFYVGDDTTIVLKRNTQNGHFRAICKNNEADIPPDHLVEIAMRDCRLSVVKRPRPVLPTYEQVHNTLLHSETFEDEVVAVMRLFGIPDAKPTSPEED